MNKRINRQISRRQIIDYVQRSLGEIYAMEAWDIAMEGTNNPVRQQIDPVWDLFRNAVRSNFIVDKETKF